MLNEKRQIDEVEKEYLFMRSLPVFSKEKVKEMLRRAGFFYEGEMPDTGQVFERECLLELGIENYVLGDELLVYDLHRVLVGDYDEVLPGAVRSGTLQLLGETGTLRSSAQWPETLPVYYDIFAQWHYVVLPFKHYRIKRNGMLYGPKEMSGIGIKTDNYYERCENTFFQVWPLTFSHNIERRGEFYLDTNPYLPVDGTIPDLEGNEGVFFLGQQGEYRLKYFPTLDVNRGDVSYETDVRGVVRYIRSKRLKDMSLNQLDWVKPYKDLLGIPFVGTSSTIVDGVLSSLKGSYVRDDGMIQHGEDLYAVHPKIELLCPDTLVSKIIIKKGDDVFQVEEGGHWSLPGGRGRMEMNPMEVLRKELIEEMGAPLNTHECVFKGKISVKWPDKLHWRTDSVYLVHYYVYEGSQEFGEYRGRWIKASYDPHYRIFQRMMDRKYESGDVPATEYVPYTRYPSSLRGLLIRRNDCPERVMNLKVPLDWHELVIPVAENTGYWYYQCEVDGVWNKSVTDYGFPIVGRYKVYCYLWITSPIVEIESKRIAASDIPKGTKIVKWRDKYMYSDLLEDKGVWYFRDTIT